MATNGSKEQLFAEVASSCTGLINRIALSYEADPSLRHELIQDILLAIWVALPNFRGDASIKTFAASIAQKRCISHVSKRAREPRQVELPGDLVSAAPAPDEAALRNDEKRLLVEFDPAPAHPAARGHRPLPGRVQLCRNGNDPGDIAQCRDASMPAGEERAEGDRGATLMTDPDLQNLAELWRQACPGEEQRKFEAMARKARRWGRVFAWLDFAAVAFILVTSLVGVFMEPGPITMVAAIALIVTTVIVTRKRRQIKQMTRTLDTASRHSFIETSISNATANLRRTRLSLAFFPLGVAIALAYKMALRAEGRTELIPATFVDWVQTPRGIITLALLALVFAWGLRTARRTRRELRRLEELRAAYSEEDRQDESDAA